MIERATGVNMNPKEYVKNVLVTEARDFTAVKDRLQETGTVRLLHAMIGMCTESGEIQDQIKKHIFYGKQIDKTNLVEEVGDLMWYVGVMCSELGVDLEDVMEKNIAKLRARYGEKFTEAAALNRNLEAERKILEG
jgi:NTP pyrophosphatase (non-canonical NTP hydrolase)